MFDLTGRKALVTGASGGIGEAIAAALHGAGATVALSGTRRDKLDAVAATLGERTVVVPANLSVRAEVDALVPAAEEAMGGLDILVSNAGITRDNLFMRMKDEEWDQVIEVALTAGLGHSRAANAGMIGMSKALAKEVASRGITVNSVAPGFIATPMTDVLNDAQRTAILSAVPAGRLGAGGDVAAAVLYLASEEAGYVTGQTLHVNGGMAMI